MRSSSHGARCALAISCAVRACTKVSEPPAGSPCSFSVSRTEPTAASGTDRSFSGLGAAFGLARPGSVERFQAASALARSIAPSASVGIRPALTARSTATWLTPRWRAWARIDNPMLVPPQTTQ